MVQQTENGVRYIAPKNSPVWQQALPSAGVYANTLVPKTTASSQQRVLHAGPTYVLDAPRKLVDKRQTVRRRRSTRRKSNQRKRGTPRALPAPRGTIHPVKNVVRGFVPPPPPTVPTEFVPLQMPPSEPLQVPLETKQFAPAVRMEQTTFVIPALSEQKKFALNLDALDVANTIESIEIAFYNPTPDNFQSARQSANELRIDKGAFLWMIDKIEQDGLEATFEEWLFKFLLQKLQDRKHKLYVLCKLWETMHLDLANMYADILISTTNEGAAIRNAISQAFPAMDQPAVLPQFGLIRAIHNFLLSERPDLIGLIQQEEQVMLEQQRNVTLPAATAPPVLPQVAQQTLPVLPQAPPMAAPQASPKALFDTLSGAIIAPPGMREALFETARGYAGADGRILAFIDNVQQTSVFNCAELLTLVANADPAFCQQQQPAVFDPTFDCSVFNGQVRNCRNQQACMWNGVDTCLNKGTMPPELPRNARAARRK
jgi:hypothetical protein